jgi:glycosyltransferase involved in cell wall biosynthesis
MPAPKKIAIVHDWLVSMRGGEKVLEVMCELFPDATLHTLVHRKGALSPAIERMRITVSSLQNLPFGPTRHRYFLPLYPRFVSEFRLDGYDLVISSSSAVANWVHVPPGALHLSYCHTPMRYIWDQYDEYFGPGRAPLAVRGAMRLIRKSLCERDRDAAARVHYFAANSGNVRERIRRLYGRESEVIYPPVDARRFAPAHSGGDYDLVVSALVPYKRVDLAVRTYARLNRRLVVAGDGPELGRLRACAAGAVEFTGWVSDEDLVKLYGGCRMLIFPGEEDFGIIPLEAMASGKPVVAFAKGGALETVIDGVT